MLPSKEDPAFHTWAAQVIAKYPNLLGSFTDLQECWYTYHPKQGTSSDSKDRK